MDDSHVSKRQRMEIDPPSVPSQKTINYKMINRLRDGIYSPPKITKGIIPLPNHGLMFYVPSSTDEDTFYCVEIKTDVNENDEHRLVFKCTCRANKHNDNNDSCCHITSTIIFIMLNSIEKQNVIHKPCAINDLIESFTNLNMKT